MGFPPSHGELAGQLASRHSPSSSLLLLLRAQGGKEELEPSIHEPPLAHAPGVSTSTPACSQQPGFLDHGGLLSGLLGTWWLLQASNLLRHKPDHVAVLSVKLAA